MPRIYTAQSLQTGQSLLLEAASARHVQVLRLQPGSAITLFNGQGGEYEATVEKMGRSDVQVSIGAHHAVEREAARAVHLAIGMPANERMDWLVEKATELGAVSIQPLMTERSVLRLSGERAEKKQAHWQAIAIAACEQSGRNRVPLVHLPISYEKWPMVGIKPGVPAINSVADQVLEKALLSLQPSSISAANLAQRNAHPLLCLAGPEGGLTAQEEQAAIAAGFAPLSLGERVLRSETAPLAALAFWTLMS
jgi:16S rRNA (uracil1498-N3)-methyltransferase